MVNTEQLLARRYAEITGFGIPKEDEELIVCKGGAPTYGEGEIFITQNHSGRSSIVS